MIRPLFLAFALTACAQTAPNSHNSAICGFMAARDMVPPTDFSSQSEASIECVDVWAARLSRSDEPIGIVVDAALAACSDTFNALARFAVEENIDHNPERFLEARREQALFRAVQWRAGNCKLPEE